MFGTEVTKKLNIFNKDGNAQVNLKIFKKRCPEKSIQEKLFCT